MSKDCLEEMFSIGALCERVSRSKDGYENDYSKKEKD
jgi:hypothetical protein